MRLIINALPALGEESGIGNYTRHIGEEAMDNGCDVTFFYGYRSRHLPAPASASGISWLASLTGVARKGSIARRVAKKGLCLANALANAVHPVTWDCYFEPNFVFLPTIKARCNILTIHDFSCFRYPQWHPADRVAHMEKCFWDSSARATRIVTVSETIRREAQSMYGIAAERITAIPNGVDHALFRPASASAIAALRLRHNLPAHFILNVGSLEPRKNLCNLLKAHSLLPVSLRQRYPLLLVAAQGWRNAEIMEMIHQQAAHVRLIGHVSLDELPVFYSAAAIFAYPSWYEGFGLPVLEAMACGCPALTSTDPALAELGQDATVQIAPDDVEGMAAAMRQLLEDEALRQRLANAAIARAAAFSWKASAQSHLRLFAETCKTC